MDAGKCKSRRRLLISSMLRAIEILLNRHDHSIKRLMAEKRHYVDFEIIKEPWNKYSLKDGSELKTRTMLKSAWYVKKNGNKKHAINLQTFHVVMCDPSLQGEKNQVKYTNEQISQRIEVEDSRYDTIAYEANEYLLDDGAKILIHNNITSISRTDLFNDIGDRIYRIRSEAKMTITPGKIQ